MRKSVLRVSDQVLAVQPQQLVREVYEVDGLYYLCSEKQRH